MLSCLQSNIINLSLGNHHCPNHPTDQFENDFSNTNILCPQFQIVYLRESTVINTVTYLTLNVQNYHR